MLKLDMRSVSTPGAEEVVITTPEGRVIRLRFLGWHNEGTPEEQRSRIRVGFEAEREVAITRETIDPVRRRALQLRRAARAARPSAGEES